MPAALERAECLGRINLTQLRQGDRTVLQPNMTFHVTLGMWLDNWGFELSEVLRIREQGELETFSTVERKLFVKD